MKSSRESANDSRFIGMSLDHMVETSDHPKWTVANRQTPVLEVKDSGFLFLPIQREAVDV